MPGTTDRKANNTKRRVQSADKMIHTLDLRGMILPFTMLKLSNEFRKMRAGEVLEIIGTNPDDRQYILEILTTLHSEILGVHKKKDCYLIRIRKLDIGGTHKPGKKKDQKHVQGVSSIQSI
jgi:TusA-related sulfurtransferase